ncbi:MAG: hypothetical protein LKG11_04945 [Bacilli bacterium]|jgi:hypothetical protein|nr:hypothetical protein [Bacilli bacterium]
MAWIWFKGKKRKVTNFEDNPAAPKGCHNFTLWVEGDRKGTAYDVSFLRCEGVRESPAGHRQNEDVLKAARAYFRERRR